MDRMFLILEKISIMSAITVSEFYIKHLAERYCFLSVSVITSKEMPFCQFIVSTTLVSQLPDKGVFWQLDYQRFDLYLRDQHIVNAIAERVDKVSYIHILSFYYVIPIFLSYMVLIYCLYYKIFCKEFNYQRLNPFRIFRFFFPPLNKRSSIFILHPETVQVELII